MYRWLRRITIRKLIIPLFRSKHTPEYTARGAAVGLAIAMTPLVGIQMPLTFAAWFLMRSINRDWDFNLPVGVAWNWVTNVFTLAPIYYVFFLTGRILMGDWDQLTGFGEFEAQLAKSLVAEAGFFETLWIYSVQLFEVFGIPMFVGCLPWAVGSAWLGYHYTLKLIERRQQAKLARRARPADIGQ